MVLGLSPLVHGSVRASRDSDHHSPVKPNWKWLPSGHTLVYTLLFSMSPGGGNGHGKFTRLLGPGLQQPPALGFDFSFLPVPELFSPSLSGIIGSPLDQTLDSMASGFTKHVELAQRNSAAHAPRRARLH